MDVEVEVVPAEMGELVVGDVVAVEEVGDTDEVGVAGGGVRVMLGMMSVIRFFSGDIVRYWDILLC